MADIIAHYWGTAPALALSWFGLGSVPETVYPYVP